MFVPSINALRSPGAADQRATDALARGEALAEAADLARSITRPRMGRPASVSNHWRAEPHGKNHVSGLSTRAAHDASLWRPPSAL